MLKKTKHSPNNRLNGKQQCLPEKMTHLALNLHHSASLAPVELPDTEHPEHNNSQPDQRQDMHKQAQPSVRRYFAWTG